VLAVDAAERLEHVGQQHDRDEKQRAVLQVRFLDPRRRLRFEIEQRWAKLKQYTQIISAHCTLAIRSRKRSKSPAIAERMAMNRNAYTGMRMLYNPYVSMKPSR
jgi:hypothetical protein